MQNQIFFLIAHFLIIKNEKKNKIKLKMLNNDMISLVLCKTYDGKVFFKLNIT